MGGSESKTSSHHDSLLSEDEKHKAQALFTSISHGKKSFTKDQFQHPTQMFQWSPLKWLQMNKYQSMPGRTKSLNANSHLDSILSDRLFNLICGPVPQQQRSQHHHRAHLPHHQTDHEVHQNHFLSHLGVILNGSLADKAKICMALIASPGASVSCNDLISFVTRILESYEKLLAAHCMAFQSWIFAHGKDSCKLLAKYLLADLISSGAAFETVSASESDSNKMFSETDIETWLTRCSLFYELFDQVLSGIFPLHQGQPSQMTFTPRVPQVQDTNWSRFKTILDFPTILFLNHALPHQQQTEWKLLFSNQTHGGSFSQLLQNIRNKGAACLVVRDQDGHIFGGYSSTSWDINSKFQGNEGCYLFKLHPFFGLYRPTGFNENYMYMNFQVQTLPNGVGMGGQLDYFGLWIDQSFDNGHSKAGARGCTTYGSPQLSGKTEFKVDTIEVWAVGKNKKDDEDDEDGTKKSILDKVDNADKVILDMIDRGTISDAIRDEPEVEETSAHNTIISPF